MIIELSQIPKTPGFVAGSIQKETSGGNSVNLSFLGFVPPWAGYMDELTITLHGTVLFHGKVNSNPNSNEHGETSSNVRAEDMFSLLSTTAQPEQSSAVNSALGRFVLDGRTSLRAAGSGMSFAKLERVSILANGWTTSGKGVIKLTASTGLKARRCLTTRRVSSGASTLRDKVTGLLTANRDMVILVDYEEGEIAMRTLAESPVVTLNTETQRITEIRDVEPQYDNCITAATVVVVDSANGIMRSASYPEAVDVGSVGAKIYKVNAAAKVSDEVWTATARQLYDSANAVQWAGSITIFAEDLESDPLGARVNVIGPGTHPDWHTMAALVTATQYDIKTGLVTLTLGALDKTNDESSDLDDESYTGGDDPGGGSEGSDGDGSDGEDDTTEDDFPTMPDIYLTDTGTTKDTGNTEETPPTGGGGGTSQPGGNTETIRRLEERITLLEKQIVNILNGTCNCTCDSAHSLLEERIEELEKRPQYTFDGLWFVVSADNVVTINTQMMETTAISVADGLQLDVQVEGDVEQTTATGSLRTLHASLAYSGSSVSPPLDTNIHY